MHSIDLGETLAAGLFLSTAFRNYGDVWVGRIPLLAEEGWRDSLIEAGAPGAKREPDRAKPQLMFGETLRRSDHPDCAASVASRHSFEAQPPLLCEEGNITQP